MKLHLSLLAIGLAFATHGVGAATLPKNQVASDAKWLLHLDLQNLRRSQVGEFLTKNVLEKAVGDLKSKAGIDVGALIQRIDHITAYGTDFAKHPEANGILLVQLDAEGQKILDGFLAAQMLADSKESVKKEQQGASVLYSVNKELFVSVEPNHLVLAGKSQNQIEKARDVLAGKAANLSKSEAFSDFPAVPDAFFLLAVAEGFNENIGIPPQAKVLQMAEGGRVVIGEQSGKLFLDLALRAKAPEVSEQIQQVFEGIRAMFSLSQTENQDLQDLVRSIKVSNKNRTVTVNVELPVATLLKKIGDKVTARNDGKEGTSKPKGETERKPEPGAETQKKNE